MEEDIKKSLGKEMIRLMNPNKSVNMSLETLSNKQHEQMDETSYLLKQKPTSDL